MTVYHFHCNWLPANNFLFQIANIWLVLSYLCPPTLKGLIFLRLTLGFAGLFFSLWGWMVLCAPDTFVWNLFFFIGNFLHLAYIFFSMRTIKFPMDMEEIYMKIFEPLKLPRHQFKLLVPLAKKSELCTGHIYVIDGTSECKTLAVLLSGRIYVKKHGKLVHVIEDNQFINSPEWVMSENDPYLYEVTMKCHTECTIMEWDRNTLLNLLQKNIYLKTVIDSVVSKDIAQKIFSMNGRLKLVQGQSHSIYSLNELANPHENCRITVSNASENSDGDHDETMNCKTQLLNNFHEKDKETVL